MKIALPAASFRRAPARSGRPKAARTPVLHLLAATGSLLELGAWASISGRRVAPATPSGPSAAPYVAHRRLCALWREIRRPAKHGALLRCGLSAGGAPDTG